MKITETIAKIIKVRIGMYWDEKCLCSYDFLTAHLQILEW